jgi:four helix bundle protein
MPDVKGKGYRKLVVWQEAMKLVVLVYELTGKFPKSEVFGLTSQMRRAAVSVVVNLAEGWLRRSVKGKLRYLEVAEGSLLELETEGEVVRRVGYLAEEGYKRFDDQRARTAYLLFRYKGKIQSSG